MTFVTDLVDIRRGASQRELAATHKRKPKIRLKAPTADGAANKALVGFLAELWGVPGAAIRIESGMPGRIKPQITLRRLAGLTLVGISTACR